MTIKGYASVRAAQPVGIDAELVTIEIDLTQGLHAFSIIGLPDKAMEEARDRISAAIRHAGFKPPKSSNRRIVLSLAPAGLRKEGAHYDLPLALCYLAAAEEVPLPPAPALFAGELGLDGTIRPVRGLLAQVRAARRLGITDVFVPPENAAEAALVEGVRVFAPDSLHALIAHCLGAALLAPYVPSGRTDAPPAGLDLSAVRGQEQAKRALEIAAAGGHNLVLYGPPGTGKTMLARCVPGMLPSLAGDELLEVTAIHSAAGLLPAGGAVTRPPFRAPHHTASVSAIIGGGHPLRPGEATLAHGGVLFLDEFPEFDPRVLEALREPLEERVIRIARAHGAVTFPADCMLVAAMNPAETLAADASVRVRAERIQRSRLSRPIADRLDLWVETGQVPEAVLNGPASESSRDVRARIAAARTRMRERDGALAGRLASACLEQLLRRAPELRRALSEAADRLNLSPRAMHRTLRVARTIADLAGEPDLRVSHVAEALQFRPRGFLGHE